MKKKLKSLKNGEVFEVAFPDGKKIHCQLTNVESIKRGKHTLTFYRKDGQSITLSNEEKVNVIFSGNLPDGVHEAAKKALDEEKRAKGLMK